MNFGEGRRQSPPNYCKGIEVFMLSVEVEDKSSHLEEMALDRAPPMSLVQDQHS